MCLLLVTLAALAGCRSLEQARTEIDPQWKRKPLVSPTRPKKPDKNNPISAEASTRRTKQFQPVKADADVKLVQYLDAPTDLNASVANASADSGHNS